MQSRISIVIMDKRSNQQFEEQLTSTPSSSSSSSSNVVAEVSKGFPISVSEQALLDLQQIKKELEEQLRWIDKMPLVPVTARTNLHKSDESTTSSEASDVQNYGSDVPAVFGSPNVPEDQMSVTNVILEPKKVPHQKRRGESKPVRGVKGAHGRRMMTDKEMADLEKKFNVVPKLSLTDIQTQHAEDEIKSHKRICELNAEVTVKAKESELLEYQLTKNHTELHVAKSKIVAKEAENEKLRREILEVESKSSRRILELTLDVQQKASKLEMLENLFSEINERAESVPTGDVIDPVTSARIIHGPVPNVFHLKLQQSTDLAQRLKAERDHLERCRDESDRKVKDIETKYQCALIEMNKLKIGEDSKLLNAKASLQIKSFEVERGMLVLHEYQNKYRAVLNENQELKEKYQCLTEQLNETRLQLSEETTRLSMDLQTKTSKLELYEKIEDAMDEMIVKAAFVPDSNIGNDLLSFCSTGASLPTDARRRLQQAFDLAKRNCELEKIVAEQKTEILELYDERHALRQEVETVKSLNGHSVTQLVETITQKNREINKLNTRMVSIEQDFFDMKNSNEVLHSTIANLKGYHEQLVTLYHAGTRAGHAKFGRQASQSSVLDSATTLQSTDVVSSKSSMRLRQMSKNMTSTEGQCIGTSTAQSSSSKGEMRRPTSFGCGDSRAASMSDSTCVLPSTSSRFLLDQPSSLNVALHAITEESDNDSNSVSSLTSSMFFPAPPMVRTRSPLRVSVRKISSKSSSSRSRKSATAGGKPLPGRQAASAESAKETNKKKEKPVALRLTKVKPTASNFF